MQVLSWNGHKDLARLNLFIYIHFFYKCYLLISGVIEGYRKCNIFFVIAGLGFGLMYLPAIVSVTHYFESKRSFATGLAVCGSGLGTFIFAPLSKILVDEYRWQGAALIESAIILNCILCGALFRPLTSKSAKNKYDVDSSLTNKSEKEALVEKKQVNGNSLNHVSDIHLNEDREPSLKNLVLDQLKSTETRHPREINFFKSDGAINNINRKYSTQTSELVEVNPSFHRDQSLAPGHNPRILYRKDIFYSGSLMNIAQYKSPPDMYITSVQSIPESVGEEEEWFLLRCLNLSPVMSDAIHQMLDFSLLKDVIFVIFVISNFCTSIGFNMPYIYLPDRAHEKGISESDSAFLVSVIGIANTLGRIIFGWMADRQWVNRLMLYNTALVICGIATALSPLDDSKTFLLCYAAVFGAFIGR